MQLTDYQAMYLAHQLTRRSAGNDMDKLAGTLVDAQVDLNPHQIAAALFAFQSPFSNGVVLADEVGLGKTIEAGLVISQLWAERKRRILVITPANLRKQWFQELADKFFLPSRILETKSYNTAVRAGDLQPFAAPEIVICSYQFARNKASDVASIPWDLVVIDEAHRLRNVYKSSNVIANTLKTALHGRKKLLLTATPLQNSLLELYGLVSFIDDFAFGNLQSFKLQYSSVANDEAFDSLKARLKPVCHRTLRRQVVQYVPYTSRRAILEEFVPEESEDALYDRVSEYLRRPNLQALPSSQRALVTMVLRKLLASSSFAIAGALETMSNRLKARIARNEPPASLNEELGEDYEGLAETEEEWDANGAEESLSVEEREATIREIRDLDAFTELARSIDQNAKGTALLTALTRAFAEAKRLGAPHKAVVFTESRRTQDYLQRILAETEYRDKIVLFNGSNTDAKSKAIYADWVVQHRGSDRVTGSRTADMRSAIVDYFREDGQIMIATEAAAEGINLQFCSLVVNYDLPWNPQRIEQRIGRCHRYGQKHDVVVVNFLNKKNEADQRVYQLLAEKFHLFEGVFGASDEVLGSLESGVDIERRIAEIYQLCRTTDEIQAKFQQLQFELDQEIKEEIQRTRTQLLENFDAEVTEKLRVQDASSKASLNRFEQWLMQLTRHELDGNADFLSDAAFQLHTNPFGGGVPLGLYELPRRSGEAHFYRLTHPLAEAVLRRAKGRELPPAELVFDYSAYSGRIARIERLVGAAGWLTLAKLSLESPDQAEDHLLVAAVSDDGETLDGELATRLLMLPVAGSPARQCEPPPTTIGAALAAGLAEQQAAIRQRAETRNAEYYEQEQFKLDAWADDLRTNLRRQIKELEAEHKLAKRAIRDAGSMPEKIKLRQQADQLQRRLDDAEVAERSERKKIQERQEGFLDQIAARLDQQTRVTTLFEARWRLV